MAFIMSHILPKDFLLNGWHIGISKDANKFDFGVLYSKIECNSAVLFTKNNFPGWPVIIGREAKHLNKNFRAIIVNSGNANVANGEENYTLAKELCKEASKSLNLDEGVLPASTGVIGRSLVPYKAKLLQACKEIPSRIGQNNNLNQNVCNIESVQNQIENFAQAISTTDAYLKIQSKELKNGVRILGVAKGAGMIEPNMATMLSFICTDAEVAKNDLEKILLSVANKSFNRISVDSDTSTSDTLAILANGSSKINISFPDLAFEKIEKMSYPLNESDLKEKVGLDENTTSFYLSLLEICVQLSCLIVRDGEGATKLIEVNIREASNVTQALKIGRSIINSPLFKTAIFGGDPNWGRLLMAIGKVFDEPIQAKDLKIFIGPQKVFPPEKEEMSTQVLSSYLKENEKISIKVFLGQGDVSETLWGCDLNQKYIHINSAYTT